MKCDCEGEAGTHAFGRAISRYLALDQIGIEASGGWMLHLRECGMQHFRWCVLDPTIRSPPMLRRDQPRTQTTGQDWESKFSPSQNP